MGGWSEGEKTLSGRVKRKWNRKGAWTGEEEETYDSTLKDVIAP